MNNNANPFVRIFLSYRRDDVPDAVDRIADRLRERFGTDGVFVDISSIDAGEKWRDVLTSAIEKCAALLIVIGPRWLRKVNGGEKLALDNPDDLVRKEIATALSRDISIIPILWGDAKFPSSKALPSEVRRMAEYQAFSIRREHFESDMHLLLERIEAQVHMFASLGRRLGAFIIDLLPALAITYASGGDFWAFWASLVVYHWLLVGFFGRTFGKFLMGTRVESSQPPLERWIFALARPLFGYPIMVFSGIGAVQLILHPQHVGIHDRLFHTQILQTRKLPWAAGLGRIDGISYSFDEWLLKLLAGIGLGSLMQWAELVFGIDQPVKWVRNIFKRFGVGTTSGAQVGAGVVGAGVLSVVAPPLIVGFLLAAISLAIYEGVTPTSLSILKSDAQGGIVSAVSGDIVFASDRDGVEKLYTMNTAGDDVQQLTNEPATDPVWSLNGQQIAYLSNSSVFVMSANGGNPEQLTHDLRVTSSPTWSPDGKEIAFLGLNRDQHTNDIFIMNIDGNNNVRMIDVPHGPTSLAWSPKGDWLLFDAFPDLSSKNAIFKVHSNGNGRQQLTDNTHFNSWATWSPSGDQIAFVSDRDGSNEVYVMNTDGTGIHRITTGFHIVWSICWSSNDSKIYFASNRDGDFEIYSINEDGEDVYQLTNNQYDDYFQDCR